MKKNIFTSALLIASILMSSCMKETEIGKNENMGEVPVSLMIAGSDHAETRGTAVTTSSLSGTFKIYAYQKSGTNYVNADTYSMKGGVTATLTGSGSTRGATLAQPHYWPASNLLDFYAVYPESWADLVSQGESSPFTPTITTETHNVNVTMGLQTDVLYAYTTGTAKGNAVNIQFLHALTRVTFQGKIINNTPVKITNARITEIKVKNVPVSGTFSFTNASGTWSKTGTQTATASGLDHDFLAAPGVVDPTDYIGSFFLIPMTGASALTGVKLDVTVTSDNTGTTTYSDISLPATPVTEWNAGDWVNYTIQLDADNGQVAMGQVTVKEWVVTSGGTVIINP